MADPAALRWIDNHCHLPAEPRAREELIAEATAGGVARLITVGCDVPGSQLCLDIARVHPQVWATAGVHPHDAKTIVDPHSGAVDTSGLEALLTDPRVVAVGECGLDYHYDHSPRDQQRAAFVAQIALAKAHQRALVIHTRDAWADTFEILEAEGIPERTVFHCFTGGPDEATWAIERGIRLSFSGIVTFPSATELREAALLCPLHLLLVETDSPYLAPVPHRGTRNRPALVTVVGEAVAAVKGLAVEAVAEASWTASQALYHLP
jgi:TatD DNase family protein